MSGRQPHASCGSLTITEGAPFLAPPSPHPPPPESPWNSVATPFASLQVKSRFGNLHHTPKIKTLSNCYPVNTRHSSGLKCTILSWFLWNHDPIVPTKGTLGCPSLSKGQNWDWPKAVKWRSCVMPKACLDMLKPVVSFRALWVHLACGTPFHLLTRDQSKISKQGHWEKRKEITWGARRPVFALALVLYNKAGHKASRNLLPHQKRWVQNNQLPNNRKEWTRFYEGKKNPLKVPGDGKLTPWEQQGHPSWCPQLEKWQNQSAQNRSEYWDKR